MGALTTTFSQLLADNMPDNADRTALIDGEETVTYARLAEEADRVAGYLLARGVRPGDRVIVQLRKSVAEVAAMFGVAQVGAVFVNVNAQWTATQLAYVADDCRASALIVDPVMARRIAGNAAPASVRSVLVAGDPPLGFDGWAAMPAGVGGSEVERLDTELAAIVYTSGSTGMPKGVMLSHRNIVAGARSVARYLRLGGADRLLSVLPYSFDYGLNQLTTMMLLGGAVVHQPLPMATEVVRAMAEHEVTGVGAVPPLWCQIVRLLDARPGSFPKLRRVTNSGGKIPSSVLERLPHVFPGVDIHLMYGLTEAFRSTHLSPDKFAGKQGSIGRAIPGAEVHVVKHGEGLAGPGEQGELVHRGPLVSMGYWGKPDATREKIRPCPELASLIGDEPVVYSGDTVRIDEDGDLWFVSRNDAMIKTSGFRVSPEEVEDLLHRSGVVADAVAFGVSDELLGQVVHVAVTPLPGFDREALMRHCRGVMPPYMVPRVVHLWPDAMPRSASGKLARPDVIRDCSRRGQPTAPTSLPPTS